MKNQPDNISLYKPADKWIVINQDEDLTPIYISQPEPPPIELIDGYGEHPDNQRFIRKQVPRKLIELEKRCFSLMYDVEKTNKQETVQGYKVYQKFWDLLEEEADHYEAETQWIKNIWWWRTYGYWFFNDGQPTYMSGDYFDFLTFWYIKEAETYPDFREKDRIKYLFADYLEKTTETFANIDTETGRAIKEEDGHYVMQDVGSRVFFGDVEPKTRRSGATHQGVHKVWKGNSTALASYGTIISMDGDNAEKHYYKKLIPAWNKYPLFLKPIWVGSKRPTSIKMSEPPNVFHIEGLGSMIDFTESAGTSKNDGDRLNFILQDEQGKSKIDIFERWHVNKIAMSTGGGSNIIGYCKNPSTVETLDEGGITYYKLCQLSDFYRRIPSKGQTYSGLARIFFPAYEGLEGFIDRFGKSVINDPTDRQIRLSPNAKFAISNIGSKKILEAERDALLADGSPEALESYRSIRRKAPFTWAECWLGSAGNVGFDLEKIDRRIGEINRMKSFGKQPYKRGNFYREGGSTDGNVLWQTDMENGKFIMSMDIAANKTNQRVISRGWDASKGAFVPMWKPIGGDVFTCGADPFRYINAGEAKKTGSQSRQSDGGIAILWEHDASIDKSTNVREWQSRTFILTYRNRPASQREYNEDVLMACQYYGAMIFVENNVDRLWEYFIERGYGAYLIYDVDILTGKRKERPGVYSLTESKNELFAEMKDYIEFRIHKENHDDLLKEIKDIKGADDMTTKDLFTAAGMALLGSKTKYRQIRNLTQQQSAINLDSIGIFKKKRI